MQTEAKALLSYRLSIKQKNNKKHNNGQARTSKL